MTDAYVSRAPSRVVASEDFADPTAMANYLMQSVPHWFEAVVEDRQMFDQLWDQYSAVHGKPWDPIRIVQFMHLMKVANAAPAGEYGEFGSHKGFMTRVIYKLMDPAHTLYSFDTFEGFAKADIEVEKQIYAMTGKKEIFSRLLLKPWRTMLAMANGRRTSRQSKAGFPNRSRAMKISRGALFISISTFISRSRAVSRSFGQGLCRAGYA